MVLPQKEIIIIYYLRFSLDTSLEALSLMSINELQLNIKKGGTNMTQNQIAYWNLRETNRTNLANEKETNRANLAREAETNRSNLAREKETNRNNFEKEKLSYRNYVLDKAKFAEQQRMNTFANTLAQRQQSVNEKNIEIQAARQKADQQYQQQQVAQQKTQLGQQYQLESAKLREQTRVNNFNYALGYFNALESRRKNKASESIARYNAAENVRSHQASENISMKQLGELSTHNRNTEWETKRHNLMTEFTNFVKEGNKVMQDNANLLLKFSGKRGA